MNIVEEIEKIEGWLSREVAELLISSARKTPPGCIVEIGSWKGKSTICLAKATESKKVYAIDPFTGSQEHKHQNGSDIQTFNEFQENIKRYRVEDRIKVLVMTSVEAIDKVPDPISLLWIDGSHEYEDVVKDFELWFPRLIPGGIVLFHDSKWQGVKKVLWENFLLHMLAGPVDCLEDTTFAVKLDMPNDKVRKHNLEYLRIAKQNQKLKNLKRRLNKWSKKNLDHL